MKKAFTLFSMLLITFGTALKGYDSTFMDYQNYNHGYCPECSCYPCKCDVPYYNVEPGPPPPVPPPPPPCPVPDPCSPCDPCAPVCGTQCGISICAIGVAIAGVAAAAAIIIGTGGSSSTAHAP